jgi:hypothetical protein
MECLVCVVEIGPSPEAVVVFRIYDSVQNHPLDSVREEMRKCRSKHSPIAHTVLPELCLFVVALILRRSLLLFGLDE